MATRPEHSPGFAGNHSSHTAPERAEAARPAEAAVSWPQSDAERRLAQLFTPSPEVAETQRAALRQVVRRALKSATTDHERQALILAGNITEWQLFDPSGPLPPGLILSEEGGEGILAFDARLSFVDDCATAAVWRLGQVGLEEVTAAVKEDLVQRTVLLESAAVEVLKELPEYAFIQSFDIRLPGAPEEQPLPPAVRNEREQQVRNKGRADARLEDWEPLATNRNARQNIRRGMQRLEDETMPQKTEATSGDALQRAREYLFPRLAAVLQEEHMTLAGFEYDGKELQMRIAEDANIYGAEQVIGPYVEKWLETVGYKCSGAVQSVRGELLRQFIECVFAGDDDTYQQVAERTVSETAGQMLNILISRPGIAHRFGLENEPLAQLCHTPTGAFEERKRLRLIEQALHARCPFYDAVQRPRMLSREQMEQAGQRQVGYLDPQSTDMIPGRIIQVQPLPDGLPSSVPNEDVILEIQASYFGPRSAPHIPGYRLVSKYASFYGFVRDTYDPYARADVPIDETMRTKAVELARRIGLEPLAEAIAAAQGLTVAGFSTLLERANDYVVADDPSPIMVDTFDDYAQLVKDGRMIQQCSFTGDFQRLFLDSLFGVGSASLVQGYTVNKFGAITALRHVQTAFIAPDGRQYILDATPPGNYFEPLSPAIGVGNAVPFASPPQGEAVTGLDLEMPAVPEVAPLSEAQLRAQRLDMAYSRLESYLQVMLRAPDTETLHQRLAALPEADPTRRTYELLRQAIRGMASPEDLAAAATYAQKVAHADAATLKSLGIQAYDPHFLETLQESALQVQAVLAEAVQAARAAAHPAAGGIVTGTSADVPSGVSIEELHRGLQEALGALPFDEAIASRRALSHALSLVQPIAAASTSAQLAQGASQLEVAVQSVQRAIHSLRAGRDHINSYRQAK